ncbi:sulfatase [Sphingobium sp. DEHP117]|uniref:sulfatase family protein n=1 Tax=Sphingobium sp. DEHP117 TaxID=2993436 RepID=UPI0027D511CD|nr:sulfatase-like hydrolase/transferase [Sphingobium sp. DEHP117]MDQ4421536.1 sulfatase [Sphingobium sp. DEHP117]
MSSFSIRKREFLLGGATTALAGFLPGRTLAQAAVSIIPRKRMNLLLITADDLDWSLPGFMGGKPNLMPNLDALARRSHRFVANRTVAPICMPSREAMMTGLVPHRSGGTGFTPVNLGTPTLVTLLKDQGYYTAAIHKVDHMLPQECFAWDYVQQSKDRSTLVHANGFRVALEEARNGKKPFFINCNSNDPHRPFYGSPQADKVDHNHTGAYKVEREVRPDEVVVPPTLEDLPDIRLELSQYWNSAQRLDIAIGNILRALDESGERDNTIVMFCSDHGMPLPFAKATCYDHGSRVPVLISWPGMGEPREFTDLTTHCDILPTLLDLLGVPAPSDLDGQSWLPQIEGKATERREFVVTYVNTLSSGFSYPMRAIQDQRYALVFSSWADGKLKFRSESMFGLTFNAMVEAAKTDPKIAARVEQYTLGIPMAFYDLKTDPGQRLNLASDKRHSARIRRMTEALLQEMERTKDPELANVRAILDGKPTVVPQDPERYRLRGGGD